MKDLFLIIILCFLIISFCYLFSFLEHDSRKVLLQQTNFPELLKAGRYLISKAEWKDFVAGSGQRVRSLCIPEDVNIPDVIIELIQKFPNLSRTRGVSDSGYFSISYAEHELGFWGINIYPDDFVEPEEDFFYGDKMLSILNRVEKANNEN